ncbi:glucose 1-dehydrogenase [Aetokthonos hydrillicola Thurmond2011]|jgi:glucose 1-dehydrogenase|uniref:Glucose 1-dehydrogenase n=1 Tax=Aetokthonos hydrillicola Thurmond2011 TaxID=2712845 RepID=A0AAP5M952_9CYAN|nr:glucose 1-dehydrogenase [Aetokthonos hydrillicola]MBO3459244.1 glucose 1-dehydrogenase [Aetokthonos hydrillicola CCALA 1050]MBW4584923.1 glucose 1-dehydrogenase [Aetokthonos hydrillicola CCALA 1050]MDR9894318.1 glucose 1-dehydrogenase [Aetokthonos hydrillicola Thurmond2011]
MKLEGKVALVTGSSQGIGQAIAIRLAEEGANIIIDYRSHPQGAEETKTRVEASGSKGFIIKADLSLVSDIHQMVTEGIQHFGKLDILVNNAGIEKNASFWDVTEEDYDNVLNVNLKGVFFATQAIVKHLRETKRPGKIINISSVHEELPFPHFTSYCASKGGVKMMMRNLAIELGPLGITINNVAPGAINTPINTSLIEDKQKLNAVLNNIPLGRLGEPNDVASIVAFLASDDANYVTGATFFVDGGLLWNYKEQ